MFSYLIPCPRKGPSLTLLGWPHVSPAYPALLPFQGSPSSQLLLATPPFTLTSFSSSLDAPASEACPVSPSLAAFKLFILYLWFGALRKILIFYLSPPPAPFARSRVGREGSFCALGCHWRGKGCHV